MGWDLRVQSLEMFILIGCNWVDSSLSVTMVIWLLPFSVFFETIYDIYIDRYIYYHGKKKLF